MNGAHVNRPPQRGAGGLLVASPGRLGPARQVPSLSRDRVTHTARATGSAPCR